MRFAETATVCVPDVQPGRRRRRATSVGAGQPVEVGDGAADRHEDMVGRQRVVAVRPRPDEDEARFERPRAGDRPQRDRDLDGARAERLDAVGQREPDDLGELEDAPDDRDGRVSARSSPARSFASPSTDTTGGSTSTETISKPAAGRAARRSASRAAIFDRRSVNTGHAHADARGGSTSIGVASRLPAASTGRRATSWLTSMPDASIATRAWTSVTSSMTDCGPLTTAVVPSTIGSPGVEARRDRRRATARIGTVVDCRPGRA